MDDLVKKEIDLIDCYRIAIDFGLPAAEKAIAVINDTLVQTKNTASLAELRSTTD